MQHLYCTVDKWQDEIGRRIRTKEIGEAAVDHPRIELRTNFN